VIVNLHIERLVLDGLPVGSHQGPLVQAAVEAELARLLAANALPAASPESVQRVAAPAIAAPAVTPDGLGAQIGQAIFGSIGR
jgi:hypothetical protein